MGTNVVDKCKRTTPFKCQRCGICCQGRGDLLGPPEDGEVESDDCSAFDHKTRTCLCYDNRRDFCEEYPWDEWCEREQKEMGIWMEYILVDGELARRDQKGKITMCFSEKRASRKRIQEVEGILA